MPNVRFLPNDVTVAVSADAKILICARKASVAIRFGCASCRCGTCAVKVAPGEALSQMKSNEQDLLARMHLPIDGTVRLSCQAKVRTDVDIDLSFQDTYSPDDGDDLYADQESSQDDN